MNCKAILCIITCLALTSCGGGSENAVQGSIQMPSHTTNPTTQAKTADQISSEMDAVWTSIVAEVGTPRASNVSQCGALPTGAKACGGPSRYVVYSREVANEERLRELTGSYTALEREWYIVTGAASTCSILLQPDVSLVAGQCM